MEPEYVEVSMRSGDAEVMFTEVYADGQRAPTGYRSGGPAGIRCG